MSIFDAGSKIKFTYYGEQNMKDIHKEVFVLHPNWKGKVHALDLKRMTLAQAQVIDAIFDPEYQSGEKHHQYPLVNDILRRMDPSKEIKNPLSFYNKFCRPFLMTAGDVYRTYWPAKMSAIQLIKKSTMEGSMVSPQNGKPLFHK